MTTAQSSQESINAASLFSPEKSILCVLDHMENLCQVYQEESEALELRDMNRFAHIQYIKVGLVNECEQRINAIEAHKDAMKSLHPALKDRVQISQEKLNKLALESARNCKIRAESSRRVQERLLEAARHLMNQNQKRYNKQGKSPAASQNRPLATSINEAI
ncbi:MAG: hypothetical protein AAB276_08320 [Pseudomonadota bacterium]